MPTVTTHIRVWDTKTTYKDYETTSPVSVNDATHIVFTTDDGHTHDIPKAGKWEIETWQTTS